MNKETYVKMTEPFRKHPKLAKILEIINKIITYGIPVLYFGLLIYYGFHQDEKLAMAMIIPLDAFIILSVVRFFINRRRPYETFELPPVIKKNTKGKSFPSRHVFCAFVIGMTFLLWSPIPWMGIVIMVLGVFLMVVRVLSGIHYISDVIAGAISGIGAGLFFLFF